MVINLGQNSWILILLTLLEILLILVPAFISSKVEQTSIRQEILEMGFDEKFQSYRDLSFKIFIGLLFGLAFYLFGGYINYFFKIILVENLFGSEFVEQAQEGTISTEPIDPDLLQILIILILNVFIVATCEEAFFRGFILNKLQDKVSNWVAILFSAICFSFYHVPPFLVPITTILTFFGYYFVFGIILGYIFKYLNASLLPGIIAHALFNGLLIIF
ncbi:MAG: membrane protein of unknown function [Promethearchaeota archaeon]|nr:MAG: membrane protein of unknown function [Candidatus Lokiarchaeota archaeon]